MAVQDPTVRIPAAHIDLFANEAQATVRYAHSAVEEAVHFRQRGIDDEIDPALDQLAAATRLRQQVGSGRRVFVPDHAVRQTVVGCLNEAEYVLRAECESAQPDFAKARRAHAQVGAFLDLLERLGR